MEDKYKVLSQIKMKSGLKAGAEEKLDLIDRMLFPLLDTLQKPTDAFYNWLNKSQGGSHES